MVCERGPSRCPDRERVSQRPSSACGQCPTVPTRLRVGLTEARPKLGPALPPAVPATGPDFLRLGSTDSSLAVGRARNRGPGSLRTDARRGLLLRASHRTAPSAAARVMSRCPLRSLAWVRPRGRPGRAQEGGCARARTPRAAAAEPVCPSTEIKVRKRKPRLPRTGPAALSGLACPVPVKALLDLEL